MLRFWPSCLTSEILSKNIIVLWCINYSINQTIVCKETYLALDVIIDIVYAQKKMVGPNTATWVRSEVALREVECAPSTTTSWVWLCKKIYCHCDFRMKDIHKNTIFGWELLRMLYASSDVFAHSWCLELHRTMLLLFAIPLGTCWKAESLCTGSPKQTRYRNFKCVLF